MSYVPTDLKYSKEHEWVKLEGKIATIGITDHAQNQLGDIVFIELPKVDRIVELMKSFGVIESVKAASDIFSPLTGKIVAVNDALRQTPELINQDCYDKGWIVKIEPDNLDELAQLLDNKTYAELIK
ncbi:MAG: glycine cleavage system protein GcvH [Planctomycetota bacterium]